MSQQKSLARARDAISRLQQRITRGPIPKAERDWGGADVVITATPPQARAYGFYPEPRYVD